MATPSSCPGPHGVLLLAHGARDPAWAAPLDATAQRVRELACAQRDTHVILAFLEFLPPTLAQAGTALAKLGCTQVSVVPLFLGAGGHVRKDVPRLMDELAAHHPSVRWTLCAAVGETELVIHALADSAWALSHPTA